jgi:hypothetical protein
VSDPFIEAFRFEETKKRVEPVLGVFPGFGIEGDFAGGGVVIDEADFERVSVRSVEGNATGAKGFRPLLEGHRARSAIDASGLRGFGTLGFRGGEAEMNRLVEGSDWWARHARVPCLSENFDNKNIPKKKVMYRTGSKV